MPEKHDCLIIDGGLASELEARGNDLSDGLWSARLLRDNPDELRAVHRSYLDASADIITTASYQATIAGFEKIGLSHRRAVDLIRLSVQLAKQERDEFWSVESNRTNRVRPLIAASVGPYGAYLANGAEYTGDYQIDESQLFEFHRERWQLLVGEDPDIILCETIPSFPESRALAALAQETPHRSTWISFSCRDSTCICDGTPIYQCIEFLNGVSEIEAVGVNCTAPRFVSDLIEQIRGATDKRIVVYPNSGEQYDPSAKKWTGQTDAEDFARYALQWRDQGASVIGGCCRTTPRHIAAIRRVLRP